MRNYKLLFSLAFFILFFVGLSSAQSVGCCCFTYDPYYAWNIDESTCSAGGGSFNSNILDEQECQTVCYSQAGITTCQYSACQYANPAPPCFCDDILTTSSSLYCCAINLGTKIFSSQSTCISNTACAPAGNNQVSGHVYDENGAIEDALVSVSNVYTDLTDATGYYEIDAPAADYITVVAQATGCTGSSQTVPFQSDQSGVDFQLVCGGGVETCEPAATTECCPSGYECENIQSYSAGQRDCAAGWSCYLDCPPPNDACVLIPGPGGCTLGDCSIADNSYCSSAGWQQYDLTVPAEFQEYCSLCPWDGECINIPCQPTGCDGDCPANCVYPEDPDCSSGLSFVCNITHTPPLWCDSYAATGQVGWTSLLYCEHCAPQDCITCTPFCGDGLVQCGEECDLEVQNGLGFGCDNNCMFDTTTPTCTPNNLVEPYEQCDPLLDWTISCDPLFYQSCTEMCTCDPICGGEFEAPANLVVNDVWKEASLDLSWDMPTNAECNEELTGFEITRCKGSQTFCSGDTFILQQIVGPTELTYTDLGLKNNSDYCYKVTAQYKSGVKKPSSIKCQNTGDLLCLSPHPDTFCQRNSITSCSENTDQYPNFNMMMPEECTDGACIQPSVGEAYCIARGPCDNCNSVHGSFGSFLNESDEDVFRVAHELDGTPGLFFCNTFIEQKVCHFDTNERTVDMMEECADVENCYGYRSGANCQLEGNPCGQFIDTYGTFGCDWNEYEPSEQPTDFDLGVCTPVAPENQQCALCNSSNPIFPVCNVELCDLFGDCYYKKLAVTDGGQLIHGCVNAGDLSCKDYNDEIDCIGATGANFNLGDRNEMLTNSSDLFNFKKCKWDQAFNGGDGTCYRDADDSSETFPGPGAQDCITSDTTNYPICIKDFISPNTTILAEPDYIFGKNFLLPIMIEDNVYTIDDPEEPRLWAYYCFTNATTETCALAIEFEWKEINFVSDLSIEKYFSYESEYDVDEYTIYLYTKDFAKNVEVVQSQLVLIDARSPRLTNFVYDYASYDNGNQWLSNLEANFSFNEHVVCNISLKDMDNQEIPPSFSNQPSIDYTWIGVNLPDGNYYFVVECVDDHGNRDLNETNIHIKIEGDKSISDASPQNTIFLNSDIELSVVTVNEGVCKYSTETPWFAQMGNTNIPEAHRFEGEFTTTDGLYHNITINFPNSGYYRFFTACNISYDKQGGLEWIVTENNDGDWIYFSIDQLPPITTVTDLVGEAIDLSKYYQQLDVKFECHDPDWYLDEMNNLWTLSSGGFVGIFGCSALFMCEGADCEPSNTQATSKTYNLPLSGDIAKNYVFRFKSKDAAPSNEHNFEELREQVIMIDSELPTLSMIVLKNGEPYQGELTYGTYEFKVTSTKPIDTVVRFSYFANYDDSTNSQTWSLIPVTMDDNYTFRSTVVLDPNNYYDKQGQLAVNAEIMDHHDIRVEGTFSVNFNTEGGPPPIPEPMFAVDKLTALEITPGQGFKEDLGEWYPFNYYPSITLADDTSYNELTIARNLELYITGYTQLVGEVLFYKIKDGMGGMVPSYLYLQSGSATQEDEKPLKNNVLQGSQFITLDTTVNLPSWYSGYLNFEPITANKGRNAYGEYGKFYQITNAEYLGPGEGMRIYVNPPIEKDLEASASVYLMNSAKGEKWFGQNMAFEYSPANPNLYYIAIGINDSLNIGISKQVPLYIDNQPLQGTGLQPIGGAITNKNQAIEMLFQEHVAGTGLKSGTLKLTITKDDFTTTNVSGNQIQLTDFGVNNGYRLYMASYLPSGGWEDGAYDVLIEAQDYAGNNINFSGFIDNNTLSFVYDNRIPPNPLFTVDGTNDDNIDYHYRTVTDDNTPEFVLDFTTQANGAPEPLPITIPEVYVLNPTGITTSCSQTQFNIFHCTFGSSLTEGLYELQVKANKILPNGSLGPKGSYIQDLEGKQLQLIIDTTTPDFILEPEREYIDLKQPLTVYVNNLNEYFDLWSQIVVEFESMELDVNKVDNSYFFIIPEEFDWSNEGDKIIQVTIHDFAGHETTKNTNVIVDNTPPTIEIIDIEAEKGFFYPNTNATVGVRDIVVTGSVDDDTYSLCYEQNGGGAGCIIKCMPGQTEQCIAETMGRNEFTLKLVVYGENSLETLNTVSLTAKDFSGQEMTESLFVLLDLKAPGEPIVIFS